ncbi:glutamate receptor ionotropic, delta-1 [Leptopilina boulardi]|uniref:glutamate receptor ionotropic, delta-1 n=1 Tax=Leptopilina boulardi TaxID=63433 RepID=UPI0021F5D78D|nr:glutamate receptor ionotropic, delta-1 [Leptopilina boulardi]
MAGKMMPEVRITTWVDPPYSNFHYGNNGNPVLQGYAFTIFEMLTSKLNFTYKFIPPTEQILGNQDTGMVGMLTKNQVDMVVAFLPVMTKVRDYINYSVSLDEMEMTFLLRRPAESSSGAGLFAPYTPEVWYSIFATIFIIGPTAWVTIQLRNLFIKQDEMWRYSFPRCMWFAYGSLLKQGTTKAPNGDCTRLVFASWWIFVTIFSAFYTANLTAFLTLSYFTLGIHSLDDVAYGYNWFAMKGRSVESAIENNFGEFYSLKRAAEWRYGQYITDYNLNGIDMLKRIRKSKRGFMTEMQFAKMLVYDDYKNKTKKGISEAKRCTYILAPKPLYYMETAFAFQKNSTILAIINKELLRIVENGLVKYLKKNDVPTVAFCPPNLPTKEKRLQVNDILLLFKVIGYGYSAACVLFVLEGIFYVIMRFCCCSKDSCCIPFKPKIKSDDSLPAYSPPNSPRFEFHRSPPPFYQAVQDHRDAKKFNINGRDYYIVKESSGNTRLVPIRVPSSYLFHQFTA